MTADKQILEPCETFHKAVNFDAGIAPLFSDLSSEAFVETFVESFVDFSADDFDKGSDEGFD